MKTTMIYTKETKNKSLCGSSVQKVVLASFAQLLEHQPVD